LSVAAQALSRADGSFSLQVTALDLGTHWRRPMLCAYQAGRALDIEEVTSLDKAVTLRLLDPQPVHGSLVGEDDKPLVGATVTLANISLGQFMKAGYRMLWLPPEIASVLAAKTNASGAFDLRFLPPGARPMLTISAPGYGALSLWDMTISWPWYLKKAGRLLVRATSEDKAADFSGARIVVGGTAPPGTARFPAVLHESADAAGVFAPMDLPPGKYGLNIERQPDGVYHLQGGLQFEISSGQEVSVQLPALATGMVTGRVVDAASGQGVAGVRIWVSEPGNPGAVSGEGGRFAVRCAVGKASLTASGGGGYLGTSDGSRQVEVTPAGVNAGDLRVEKAYKLTVEVVDPAGRPVPEAEIWVRQVPTRQPEMVGTSFVMPEFTDERGQYVAGEFRPGPVEIHVNKGDILAPVTTVQAEKQVGPVRIVLDPGYAASATVRVVDQKGKPLPQAKLMLNEQAKGGGGVEREAPCPDARGRVTLTGLKPEMTYSLEVSMADAFPVRGPEWTPKPGERRDLGTISLTVLTGAVAGQVVDEQGRSVAGATVSDVQDAPLKVTATTDAHGHCRLPGLEEGDVFLLAQAPGRQITGCLAHTGQGDLRLTLPKEKPATAGPPIPAATPLPDRAQARRLAEEVLKTALAETKPAMGWPRENLLQLLAELDPEAAMKTAVPDQDSMDAVYLATGAAITQPGFDQGHLDFGHFYGRLESLELIWAAEKKVQSNPQLARQYFYVAASLAWGNLGHRVQAAERLRALHDPRARAVMQGIYDQAMKIEPQGNDWSDLEMVAGGIAAYDPQVALALADKIPANDVSAHDKALKLVAARVVATDPERAYALLNGMESHDRDWALAKIAPLVPADRFPRALEMVGEIHDPWARVNGQLGLVAVAPAGEVPGLVGQALALFTREPGLYPGIETSKALAALACFARRRGYTGYQAISRTALLMMGDRERYPSAATSSNPPYEGDQLELARLLAFTAPDEARYLLQAAIRGAGGLDRLNPQDRGDLIAVAALVDPSWALRKFRALPPDDPQASILPRAEAAVELARSLAYAPGDQEVEALKSGQWWPGEPYW
jgi:hypothetical protein